MTENASWSAEAPTPPAPTWSDRFRGAMLGGAVGDALGAGVRQWSTSAIQHWFGPQGVTDYAAPFGRRGAVTDLTQMSVFTLDALLQARAARTGQADTRWLPTEVVHVNHLRWLYTQGVPWERAMAPYLWTHPDPGGWLLEHRELFSTRNPSGAASGGLGELVKQPPRNGTLAPEHEAPLGKSSIVAPLVWAAPAMVWSESCELVFAAGAAVANILTDDSDTHGAAGLHADVLAQLMHGDELWDAASAADSHRLGRAYSNGPFPAAARRALYAAMFSTQGGRRPEAVTLDAEFDTDERPGELGIALASVACTDNFVDAVLMAVNQSADSSVTGALAGQLAGAIHGSASIPAQWLGELELREVIETLCTDATEAFAPPPPPPPLPRWAQRYVSEPRNGFSGPLELEGSGSTAVDGSVLAPYAVASERVEEEADVVAEPGDTTWSGTAPFESAVDEVPESSTPERGTSPTELLPMVEEPSEPVLPEVTFPAPQHASPLGGESEPPTPEPEPTPETPVGDGARVEWNVPPVSISFDVPDTDDARSWTSLAEEFPETPAAEEVPPETVEEPPAEAAAEEPPTAEEVPEEPSASTAPQRAGGGHAVVEDVDAVVPSLTERVLGCFLGGALGDALGSDLEFATAEQIGEKFGTDGPTGLREAYGVHGAITDDTQMTLFTAEGLIRGSVAQRTLERADPIQDVQLAYQRWLHTQGVEWQAAAGAFLADHPQPDGWLICVPGLFSTRDPGKTVFRALDDFGRGLRQGSLSEAVNDSKGCGGVMRAAPAALWSSDPAEVFELAARTAALTHGHPSGYLSAGAFAVIVQQAVLGSGLDDGVWLALQVLETWDGHEETSNALEVAVALAARGVPTPEQLAETLGGGWVGEEALAIAVCATLAAGDDVELALRTAVHHSGDSDSTGSVCGNIIGALVGIAGLPVGWLAQLELRDVVEQVAMDYVAEFGLPEGETQSPVDEDWNERYPVRALGSPRRGGTEQDPPTRLLPTVGAESEQPVQAVEPEPRQAEPEPRQPEPEPEPAEPEPRPAEPDPVEAEPWQPESATEMFEPDSRQPKPAPRRINNFGPQQWERPKQDTPDGSVT